MVGNDQTSVLQRLDLSKCGGSVLRITSRYLQGECSQRRRLALRGLVVPSKDPSMARRMCSVSQSLLGLLGDADGDVVSMSLHVFTNMLQHKDILVSSTTAPKLAEALLLLFDHDNRHVQLLSIQLFRTVMESVVDEGKKPLKTIVNRNLYALLIYCHDENWHVAKASRETLLCAAKFLERRNLEQLVENGNLWKFVEVLLEEDRSRVAEILRRALPYLQSPQEPLREAAVRFMGIARQSLRGQQEELQLICNALQARRQDASPSCSNLENQAQFPQRAKELGTSSGSSEPVSQEHTTEGDVEEDIEGDIEGDIEEDVS
ncbi:maestro heat-like repeat-containing protein family member 6, partial [Anomalospiza imberbis]|uniref:maestro heat-like repeat-containing protein family member 6 n=1 Tax=Anomalospiza imberbis TaxID=187417 RepID=UPI00358FACED